MAPSTPLDARGEDQLVPSDTTGPRGHKRKQLTSSEPEPSPKNTANSQGEIPESSAESGHDSSGEFDPNPPARPRRIKVQKRTQLEETPKDIPNEPPKEVSQMTSGPGKNKKSSTVLNDAQIRNPRARDAPNTATKTSLSRLHDLEATQTRIDFLESRLKEASKKETANEKELQDLQEYVRTLESEVVLVRRESDEHFRYNTHELVSLSGKLRAYQEVESYEKITDDQIVSTWKLVQFNLQQVIGMHLTVRPKEDITVSTNIDSKMANDVARDCRNQPHLARWRIARFIMSRLTLDIFWGKEALWAGDMEVVFKEHCDKLAEWAEKEASRIVVASQIKSSQALILSMAHPTDDAAIEDYVRTLGRHLRPFNNMNDRKGFQKDIREIVRQALNINQWIMSSKAFFTLQRFRPTLPVVKDMAEEDRAKMNIVFTWEGHRPAEEQEILFAVTPMIVKFGNADGEGGGSSILCPASVVVG